MYTAGPKDSAKRFFEKMYKMVEFETDLKLNIEVGKVEETFEAIQKEFGHFP